MMRLRRTLSILLCLMLVIGLFPAASLAVDTNEAPFFSDMPDNWSTQALKNAVENGLLNGADGKIMPDNNLTRAQMAAVVVRAFGASVKGDISSFSDVKASDWFANDIAKAYQMGVIKGADGKMNPNSAITRQEVFVIISRALKLQPEETINKTFTDLSKVSSWAKMETAALVNAGYVQGSDGRLNPTDPITRAQFAQLFDNIIKQYINQSGEVTAVSHGNIMVNVPGVTLKNLTVNGDLIIGDGVGDGEVILENVKVTGRMVVRGGGENSVIIRGSSSVSNVILSRVDGAVSVKVEGDANVEVIYVDDGSDDVIIEGAVGNVEVKAPDVVVTAASATISSLSISGANSKIVVDEKSKVETVAVQTGAENAKLEVSGTVSTVTITAPGTEVTGAGTVAKVEAQAGAAGAKIETPKTEIVVQAGVTGVTGGGGAEISGGSTVVNNETGTGTTTPTAPPSGGGDSGPFVVAVSGITVNKETTVLKVGETEKIIPTISPANATYKSVTWASSDKTVATVDAYGEVTAIGQGKTKITATTVDGGYTASVDVIVADIFVMIGGGGDFETIQDAIDAAEAEDTIFVGAGEYVESIIIPEGKQGLKLLGAQAGNDGRGEKDSDGWYQGRRGMNETVIIDAPEFYPLSDTGRPGSFEIRSEGVIVDGFTIKHYENYNSPPNFRSRERIWPMAENITIKNNVIERGIEPYTSQISGLKISNNWFTGLPVGNNAAAIQVNGASNLEITDNMFTDPFQCNKAINLQGGSTHSYENTTIARNQIGSSPWTGIEIQGVHTEYTNLLIEDNIIRGIGPGLYSLETAGIRLWGQTSHGNAVIRNNQIYNSAIGLILNLDMSNVTIEDNYFENNEIQVLDKDASSLDLEKVLEDNTFPEGSIAIGNEIKVFEPEKNKAYNKNSGAKYDTIQTAINEANAGDTILVGPGTYNESLTIDKSVTLRSAKGAAETKLDGDHASENYYMVNIKADNVTLDGFTITNPKYNGTADASGIAIGSAGRNSNIRVTNCVIHDIGTPDRKNVSFGTFGLNVGPVEGLEIDNCNIYNIKNGDANSRAIGIFTWGNNDTDTVANVNIHDNTIEDVGNPGNSVYGISTGFYGKDITVSNNTIKNVKSGIRIQSFMQGPVSVTGNTVENASVSGIRLDGEQTQTVTGNTISGCATGVLITETCGETAAQISGNVFAENSVDVHDQRASKPADYLEGLLEDNTFPEASQIIGDKIKAPDWVDYADTSWYDDNPTASSFTIDTAEKLAGLAKLVNEGTNFNGKTINLGSDIDLQNREWIPIGSGGSQFKGSFDGNQKKISNLHINRKTSYNGLFGCSDAGKLENVILENVNILINTPDTTNYSYTGSLAGKAQYVNNVTITGSINIGVTGGARYVGGIVGHLFNGSMSGCEINSADGYGLISGKYDVGAIAGYVYYGTSITDSTVRNMRINGYLGVGGVSGRIQNEYGSFLLEGINIQNVIFGKFYEEVESSCVGGFLGYPYQWITVTIKDSHLEDVTIGSSHSYNGLFCGRYLPDPDRSRKCILENATYSGDCTIESGGFNYLRNAVGLQSGETVKCYSLIQAAIDAADDGNTIIVGPGIYNLTESLSLGKSISIIGAGADNTIIDVSGFTGSYAFPLNNNANLSAKNITFKGNNKIGFRASSETHVEKLEFIDCAFEDFSFPIYLSERTQGAEEKDNKIDYLTIKGCTFNNNSERVYIGRGVIESALIEDNTFAGNSQIGIEFFDCWTERRTGQISFQNNSFTNEYPIVLLTGGQITINNTSITYEETPGERINVVYFKAANIEKDKLTITNTEINSVIRDLVQVDGPDHWSGDVIIHCYVVPDEES